MLSDNQVNEIIINVENVPSGVQNHLPSNPNVPAKSVVNSCFGTVSSISDIDVTDSQVFSHRNDRKAKQLLRFSPLNESFSHTHHSPDSVDMDTPCTSHENIQGSKLLGQMSKDSLPVIPRDFLFQDSK